MKGLNHVAAICAFAIVVCVGVSFSNEREQSRLVGVDEEICVDRRRDVCEVKGFQFEQVDTVKRDFPELYSTEAVIAVFEAETCQPCKRTKTQLKPHAGSYNMVFYDVSSNPNHYKLMKETLKLGTFVPVVAIIEKGEVKKVFHGYTPWSKVKPYAKKAKKTKVDEVIDVLEDEPIRDSIRNQRLRRQERFEQLREQLGPLGDRINELWIAAKTWVVENWDTILRVAVMLFMLL
jgi:hypothetical protein